MRVIAMIFAFLLVIFGGGCTVAFLVSGMPSQLLGFWFFLGLVPLVIGLFLGRSAGTSGGKLKKPPEKWEDKQWPP